jgi:hypothetical protein
MTNQEQLSSWDKWIRENLGIKQLVLESDGDLKALPGSI